MNANKTRKGISRRAFLAATVAAPTAATALTAASAQRPAGSAAPAVVSRGRRRNVLFISTDDMCNRLGCYGVPVKSPNLDRLARSGIRFDRHYCQFPLCGPSRTSLMTGLAPDTTKAWDLRTDFRQTIPQVVTLSQLFQQNGYFTARSGKIYHYNNPSEIGTPGFDDPASWQQVSYPAGFDRTHDEGLVQFFARSGGEGGAGRGRGAGRARGAGQGRGGRGGPAARPQDGLMEPTWRHGGTGPSGTIRIAQDGCTPTLPFSQNGDLGVALAGHPSEGSDQVITDYMVAEAAIAMMAEHRNEPWFIGAGFFRPHVPFIVPSAYYDLYDVNDIEVPPFDPSELSVAPPIAYSSTNPNEGMTPQQHRECLRGYYAAISFVDAQVGRLLDALQRLGLAEDTTVVFWADHGYMVGEHGQWQKMKLFEPSARVPFIMAGAGVPTTGGVCRRTSEHLDVYPTLADVCGLQGAPANLHGRSLMPLLSDPNAAWDRPAVSQVTRNTASGPTMGYSLRTERYRYTMWAGGAEGEELYDYETDPRELRNLAGDTGSETLKSQLRARLETIATSRGMTA
ncbi:MAG TPA: sulfatase [Vicinamibacterales bacterium]|nr:sulfatase [Vicinamibacterales bacterium]